MSPQISRFEIVSSNSVRPDAPQIIFCDGTGGSMFQAATDLELSHWRPNSTPRDYRAGTSTEICFRFLDKPRPGSWTVAVNNHVDVDGILSVYVLVHSDHALVHRQSIIRAAEMGDFWSWGDEISQRVFQGVTRLMNSSGEGRAVYTEAFRRIPALIDGTDSEISAIDESLLPLTHGVELVEQGRIVRKQIADRFAQYIVPLAIAGDDDERASYAPGFNEAISTKAILWPQVRARWDAERICIVSVERPTGWFHELWFPGYLWADTEGLWRLPGLDYHDGMASYDLNIPALSRAFEELQRCESAQGSWGLGGTHLPFGNQLVERFPLVGQFLDNSGRATPSQIAPDEVRAKLNVFNSD